MGSADTRAVIRRIYEAWNARDLDDAVDLYHPDAVYDCSVYLDELVEVDTERFIALLHSRGRGRASGAVVQESDAATLWTIRDGQAVHAKLFRDRRDAFAEAGIPYPE